MATLDQRVRTVRADNKIGFAAGFQIINQVKVVRFDTYGTSPSLQDLQQPEAPDAGVAHAVNADFAALVHEDADPDRKSTRLNSSHGYISYAVFCLKKKKDNIRERGR